MTASKLLNLVAITALALLASSFAPTPVNALAPRAQHLNRHVQHDAIAKRKRGTTKRCKPRPSSSLSSKAAATPAAAAASDPPKSSSAPPKSSSSASSKSSSKASATPSPTPKPSGGDTSTPSQGKGGGKVGLAWPNGDDPSLKFYATDNVIAMYTWSPHCPKNTYGIPCGPMLWGDRQVSDFENTVHSPIAGGDLLYGFNEPNQAGQSNMDPQHGCDLWHQHIQPKAAQGFKLITPATSSAPNGLTWVQNFMKCCTDCTFHGVGVHWYDTTAAKFKTYLNLWHDTFGLPLYVTEYAVQNFNGGAQASSDEIWAFHREVGPWMNSQSWIAVHMPFGFMKDMQGVNDLNRLMNQDGTPTALGSMIINNAY